MIYIILGTKGQFMKMFPLMRLFDQNKIHYKFIHTCQHYGIIEENRKRLHIKKPDMYLTMKKNDLRNIWDFLIWAPQVMWNARKLPIKKNDYVITHGDAESTLLGFLIGKFHRAKLVHVESGYRSGNILEPFPEEIIRSIVDQFSDICFCPYEQLRENIKKRDGVYVTQGNTVFDSVRLSLKLEPSSKVKDLMRTRYVPFLIHRKENVFSKQRIEIIVDILEMILERGFKVIWPIHANTKFELQRKGVLRRVIALKSKYDLELDYFFDYVDFMHAVKHSDFVASDGGGLQKETYLMNKPMLILRKRTEPEPGVGENSYLSNLKMENIKYFIDNYKKFKRKKIRIGSPTKVILDYFKNL